MSTVHYAFGRTPAAAPTHDEITQVDNGLDLDLVEAAFEAPDTDPVIAAAQQDRERLAYQGDMDAARDRHRDVLDMRSMRALADRRAHQLDDVDRER